MPQRNGKNPIKSGNLFEKGGVPFNNPHNIGVQQKMPAVICPDCKIEVVPKPGFRLSSLKCPQCNIPVGKK